MASLRRLTSLFLTGFSIATIGLARPMIPAAKGPMIPSQHRPRSRHVRSTSREVSSILSDNCLRVTVPTASSARRVCGSTPMLVDRLLDSPRDNVVADPVHIHDLNATILHCLGIDHRRLTFKSQGLDMRLTGVEEHNPVKGILA